MLLSIAESIAEGELEQEQVNPQVLRYIRICRDGDVRIGIIEREQLFSKVHRGLEDLGSQSHVRLQCLKGTSLSR